MCSDALDAHVATIRARPFLLLSDRSITARRDCAFTNVHFGYVSDEQSTATVNERANDCALSAKYARSRNYAEGLSHSSSAVVIAYQRSFVSVAICPTCGASQRPAGYPELLHVGRLGRSVVALTSDDRVVAKEKKKNRKRAIIISTTRRCLWIDGGEGGGNARRGQNGNSGIDGRKRKTEQRS